MRKVIKEIFKIFAIGLVISLLISPLRSGFISLWSLSGFKLSSIVGFIIYYFLIIYLLKNNKLAINSLVVIGTIVISSSVLTLPIHFVNFSATLLSFLEQLILFSAIFLGAVSFWIINHFNKTNAILIVIVSLFFGFWVSIRGYDLWSDKINFGTFSGRVVNVNNNNELLIQNAHGDTLNLSDFKGKYLLLDCWYSYCGICYKEMPKVQKLYDKYKTNSDIRIYALHARLEDRKETYSTGYEILNKEGYTIPVLSINMNDAGLNDFGVVAYPTVLILDKNSKLIFRGRIESASDYLEKILNE